MVVWGPLLTYTSPWWCRGPQRGPTGPHAVSTGSLHGPMGAPVDLHLPMVVYRSPKRTYGSPCGVYRVPTWSYGCPCWPTAPHGGVEVSKEDLRVPMRCLRGPYMVLWGPLLTYTSPWWCRGPHRGTTGPHAVSTGSLHGPTGASVDLQLPMVA